MTNSSTYEQLVAEVAALQQKLALAEKRHAQSRDLFSIVVDQAPMGVYVVDHNFCLQQINARAMPAFARVDARVGRNFAEVMDILWGPELGKQLSDIFRHTLATGEPYVSPRFAEFRHDLGEERAYEWETKRVTLADGEHGVVCYFNDITETWRAEQAMRDSDERAHIATEATGVGIWEWNLKTNQIRWDAQIFRIYGLEPTPKGIATFEMWQERVHPEDFALQAGLLQAAIKNGVYSTRHFRIFRPGEAEPRYIQAIETVRRNAQGEAEWLVGTNLDVTDRHWAEITLLEAKASAEAANKRKDQFLATLSHELRTPLTPVLITAETLRENMQLPQEIREQMGMIERCIALESRLLDDMFDLTAVIQGKLILKKDHYDAHSLINQTIEMIRDEAAIKNLNLVCHFEAKNPRFDG